MKIDKRIEQDINFGAKEIKIKEEIYNNLKTETKNIIKYNKVKIVFSNKVKEFEVKF